MKRLMIAAVAALCATVGFSIESANVVGYAGQTLRLGGRGTGATFVNADASNLTLGDLKVTGYDTGVGYSAMEIYVCKLTYAGASGTIYYWWDYTEGETTYYGWYDGDGNEGNDVPIALGEGLWTVSPGSTYSIQSAGQVRDGTTAVTLRLGGSLCPNPVPAQITLGSVGVAGYDTGVGYSAMEIYVCKMTYAGASDTIYYWWDYTEGETTYYGWYDGDGNEGNAVTLASGESLWVTSPDATYSLVFPSAL